MTFWSSLFGKRQPKQTPPRTTAVPTESLLSKASKPPPPANKPDAVQASPPSKKSYREKDNLGTRHDTSQLALAYWLGERAAKPQKEPFVLYTFERAEDARSALLELPCIHVAADSGKLICTLTLTFGYYHIEGVYEAILCGDDLTRELWQQARAAFAKHHGRLKNELEPAARTAPVSAAETEGRREEVVFVKQQQQQEMGFTLTYMVYKGPNAEAAKAFLQANPVSREHYYLVIETPEGNYCRDAVGIYKE